MNRALALFAIGLLFGGGIGFTFAAGYGLRFEGHDHADPAQHGAGIDTVAHAAMHANPFEVPAADAPAIALRLTPDAVSGYNLQIETRNFTFAPERASAANVTGEGHAHLYVNGEKIARLYAPWAHIASLPAGEVEIAVTLSTNDHRPIAVDGTPVAARQTLVVE